MKTRAFTLIELLVVISILALLLGLAATQFGSFLGVGREADTKARLVSLKNLLESYRTAVGDYPCSRLAGYDVKTRNDINEGIEALVVALYHKDYDGERPDEKQLQNCDYGDDQGDVADRNVTIFDKPVLLEVADIWGNPFVYIRRDDYDKEFEYAFRNPGTQEWETAVVKAARSEKTGSFYAKESYQLLSVGEDGIYGTDDDIASYLD